MKTFDSKTIIRSALQTIVHTRLLPSTVHTPYTLLLKMKTYFKIMKFFFPPWISYILLILVFLCHSQHRCHICLTKIMIFTINDNNQEYATSRFTFPPTATRHKLTLNLPTSTIVAPPSNASKWQMGFNSAFKGLNNIVL
jgi:hypothetical protein